MSEPASMPAPHTSHDAAEQLHRLGTDLDQARDLAETHARLRDRFEQMYRAASAFAGMHDEVIDLKSEDRRKHAVHGWPLRPSEREDGAKLAETMGLDGTVPDKVGDLRWLRDRAASLAESWSAKAYDRRARLSGWLVVAGMARAEMELAPPQQRRSA